VMTLTIDRWDPRTIYATACSGIYRSTEGVTRWEKLIGIPYSSRRTRAFSQSGDDEDLLLAGTTEGLWISDDRGGTWRLVTPKELVVNAVLVQPDGTIILGTEGAGGAMGIVVGSIVDGVPESLILGIQVGTGSAISLSFVAAVFVSNLPQAIAPSADLRTSGWGARKLGVLWLLVVLACGVAAALGYLFTDVTATTQGDRAAALAAGGILAMLTNSLMPFSFERGGALAGAATAVGFCISALNA